MKFLAVTDLHFCKQKARSERYYDLSARKLRRIVEEHAPGCDFIINLGDTAERSPGESQTELLREIAEILRGSGLPYYCAIGNHDTSMPNSAICDILHMPDRCYSFDTPEYTCIVLDGNHNAPDVRAPGREIVWDRAYLDEAQLAWLERTLAALQKPALIFCHELFMLHQYENADDGHVLRNRDRALCIFERSGKVKGVFCGHYHPGDFVVRNGIPYLTFAALCLYEQETCAVVTVADGAVSVDGYGLEPSRRYLLKI